MFNRFPENELARLRQTWSAPVQIAITTHHRPDGDAMGSSLALYHYLKQKGHRVMVLTPDEHPEFLDWLPGAPSVISFENDAARSEEFVATADLIFCLDYNWLNRLDKLEPAVRMSKAKRILIDHHLDPEKVFDIVFSYPDACSTCELIYQFITTLDGKKGIDRDMAECIYTGIMTDTNSFRLKSMRSETHRIIADLMDTGIENDKIHEQVYDTFPESRLRLLGYALYDKLKVINEYHTAYITLSQQEQDRFHFRPGDSEGMVNYALSIKGILLAALFTEKNGVVKISFRSKGEISVQQLAAENFAGGGHKNAAGGTFNGSVEQALKKFLDLLPEYKALKSP